MFAATQTAAPDSSDARTLRQSSIYSFAVVFLAGLCFSLFALPSPATRHRGSCSVQFPAVEQVAIPVERLPLLAMEANPQLSAPQREQLWNAFCDETPLGEQVSGSVVLRLTYTDREAIERALRAVGGGLKASFDERQGRLRSQHLDTLAARLQLARDEEKRVRGKMDDVHREFARRAAEDELRAAAQQKPQLVANPEWVAHARRLGGARRVLETLLSSYQGKHPRVIQQQGVVDGLRRSLAELPPHLPMEADVAGPYANQQGEATVQEKLAMDASFQALRTELDRVSAARDASHESLQAALNESSSLPSASLGQPQLVTLETEWLTRRTVAALAFAAAAALLVQVLRSFAFRPLIQEPEQQLGMPILGWLGEERAVVDSSRGVSKLFFGSTVLCSELILMATLFGTTFLSAAR